MSQSRTCAISRGPRGMTLPPESSPHQQPLFRCSALCHGSDSRTCAQLSPWVDCCNRWRSALCSVPHRYSSLRIRPFAYALRRPVLYCTCRLPSLTHPDPLDWDAAPSPPYFPSTLCPPALLLRVVWSPPPPQPPIPSSALLLVDMGEYRAFNSEQDADTIEAWMRRLCEEAPLADADPLDLTALLCPGGLSLAEPAMPVVAPAAPAAGASPAAPAAWELEELPPDLAAAITAERMLQAPMPPVYTTPAFHELALKTGEQTPSAHENTLDCRVLPYLGTPPPCPQRWRRLRRQRRRRW